MGMEQQYVVFEVRGESYGVEIGRVQEIDRIEKITALPEALEFVEGVINLRGHVVPIVNLRTRLGVPKAEMTGLTRVVVVRAGEKWVGLIVDAVSEVLRIPSEAVEPPPDMTASGDSSLLQGIAKFRDRLIMLLDLDRVLSKEIQVAIPVAA
jgi:purine-binding chemotaxis protein CheW